MDMRRSTSACVDITEDMDGGSGKSVVNKILTINH